MRFLRFVFTSVFFIAVAFLGAGWYLSQKYSDEIKQLVITELNKNLNAEIKIASVEFSSVRKIPYLSLSFSDVLVFENKNFTKTPDTLLYAKSIGLQFDLWDIYNKRYELKHLDIANAKCYMKESKNGISNYEVWKPVEDNSSTEFSLKLDAINLEGITYSYKDTKNKVFVKTLVKNLTIKGDFSSEELKLMFQGNMQQSTVLAAGVYALRNQDLSVNSGIIYHNDESTFELQNGTVLLDNSVELILGGFVAPNSYQFEANTEEAELGTVLQLLPKSWNKYWVDYEPSGKAIINFKIAAKSNQTPKIDLAFHLKKGSLLTKSKPQIELKELNVAGTYSNGKKRNSKSSVLDLSALRGSFPSGKFEGKLKVSDFSNLRLRGSLEGNLALQELVHFLKVETIDSCTGDVIFKLQGDIYWDKIIEESVVISKSKLNGVADFSNVSLKLKSSLTALRKYRGKVSFDKQMVRFEKSEGQLNSTNFILNGSADNFFQWALEDDEVLRVLAEVEADNLKLSEFLTSNSASESGKSRTLALPGMELQLSAKIGELNYEEFTAKNITTKLFIGQKTLKANPIKLEAMNGTARGKLAVIRYPKGGYNMSFIGDFKSVNIQELFRQFKNFGQDEIKSENIEGLADVDLNLEGKLNDQFEIVSSSVFANAGIDIREGKLVNYKTLQSISDYFKTNVVLKKVFHADELSKRLQSVSFQELQNTLFVRNSKLYIPKMQLKSNVLNVNIAGQHNFNDSVDYKVDFDISDLLVRERNYETEHGEVVDDGTGRYRVFMLLTGTTENLEIELDKSAKKAHKKQHRSQEGKELKKVLNKEFGWFDKDTTLKSEEHKTKFDIEWEEADSDTTSYSKVEVGTKQKKKKKGIRGWLEPNEGVEEFFDFEDDDF